MSGLPIPESNFFRVPNVFWEIDLTPTQRIVMLYIIRHTWGFHEYGITKRITIDEFQNGRKRADGTRLDKGTGLSRGAISQTLNQLESMGYLQVDTNDDDKARVKKSYSLVIQGSLNEHSVHDVNTEFTTRTRSEKDTKERNKKKERKDSATQDEIPFSDIPTHKQMCGHIANLFYPQVSHQRITETEWGVIRSPASQLCKAKYTLDEVTSIYKYVSSKFDSFTAVALAKYASEWRAKQRPTRPVIPQRPDRDPEPHELATPEQLAEYEREFELTLQALSGVKDKRYD